MGNFCKFFGALACVLVPCAVLAQEPPATGGAPEGGGRGGRAQEPEIRPYDRVITKDAKSDDGDLHGSPHQATASTTRFRRTSSGNEFLWVSQIAKTTLGAGYGGQAAGNRVVRWERRGDRVLLRSVVLRRRRRSGARRSRRRSRPRTTTRSSMAFNIEALGKDDAPVIEVTRLFTTDVPEFSGADAGRRAAAFDATRSFVERAVSFPENIEVEATHTYNDRRTRPRPAAGGGRAGAGGRGATLRGPAAHSVLMHYSMVKLPEKPMMPRLFDERVGYFSHAHDRLRQRRAPRAAAPLHHALAPREEGSERGDLRAGEADRLLRSIRRRRRSGCRI